MYTVYYGIKPNGEPKVGCDINYPNRAISIGLTDFRILEQYEDIMIASYREVDLQMELIGKRDSHSYYYEMFTKGHKGGESTSQLIEQGLYDPTLNLTNEGRSKGGTKVGMKNVETGQLKSIASLGGKAVGSKNGKKSQSIERTCPHCNTIIKGPLYFRWHGDNCKQNPIKYDRI